MKKKPVYIEQIMKQVKEEQKKDEIDYFNPKNNIQDGFVVVNYEKLMLGTMKFMDGIVQMQFPESFDLMSQEFIDKKYVNDTKPQYVYGKKDTKSFFTVSIEKEDNPEQAMQNLETIYGKSLKESYPELIIEEEDFQCADGIEGKLFVIELSFPKGEVFLVNYFRRLSIGILAGSFECDVDDKKQWKPIIRQLVTTLEECS